MSETYVDYLKRIRAKDGGPRSTREVADYFDRDIAIVRADLNELHQLDLIDCAKDAGQLWWFVT